MGLFDRKQKYAFSDILKGLQYAINSAQDMLQAQQVQGLMRFWGSNSGEPVTRKVKIGERELDVPLMTLVPHSHLEIDDVEIKFKAKIPSQRICHPSVMSIRIFNPLNFFAGRIILWTNGEKTVKSIWMSGYKRRLAASGGHE